MLTRDFFEIFHDSVAPELLSGPSVELIFIVALRISRDVRVVSKDLLN